MDPTQIDSAVNGHRPGDLLRMGLQSSLATPLWTPPTVEELASLFTGYRVQRLLARGGMGAVYLAQQVTLDRPVAIKILPAEMAGNPEVVERFEREARVLGRLSHPHIVPIFDFGQTATGLIYFVMEYVEGTGLDGLIHPRSGTGEPLAPDRALEIVAQVCDALSCAHAQGIVHRDLKPANVLIGRDGRARVADFGVARLTQGETQPGDSTVAGAVLGTPDYMAPEQKRGQAVDHRADIYALGVVLYEALCGERPQGAFEMPSRLRKLPLKLDHVITQAIASRPEQRFQSAVEMKRAVVTVRPSVTRAQTAQTAPAIARRKRTWLVLGAIGIIAASACVVALPLLKKKWASAASPQPPAVLPPPTVVPSRKTEGSPGAATKDAPYVNTLGMKFVPVPITGGPTDGERVLFSIWDTRVEDYRAFVAETKHDWPAARRLRVGDPATDLEWEGAREFCRWLTVREHKTGDLKPGEQYRLPSDHEWSCAAGIGEMEDLTQTPMQRSDHPDNVFPWGATWPPPPNTGNFSGEEVLAPLAAGKYPWIKNILKGYRDNFETTSPVGTYTANRFGLYDMSGNVLQWCEDLYSEERPGWRVRRGSGYDDASRASLLVSYRNGVTPLGRFGDTGFRAVIARTDFVPTPVAAPPRLPTVPVTAATMENPYVNTLGMKFVPVPITGGPTSGHRVLFSIWDTRVEDYHAFSTETHRPWPKPEFAQGPDHPAVMVSWNDGRAFCDWLTARERKTDNLGPHEVYRLPSDHEWSCAVGIGNQEDATQLPREKARGLKGIYPWGTEFPPPNDAGNYASKEIATEQAAGRMPYYEAIPPDRSDGYAATSPVGTYRPNRFGLYDMGGNVWQWCEDWYEENKTRVMRGGCFCDQNTWFPRSAARAIRTADTWERCSGFRVVLAPAGLSEGSALP